MSKAEKQLILVGFANKDKRFSLNEMLKWVGTGDEETLIYAPYKMSPIYRPETSCSQEEVQTFINYVEWTKSLLSKVGVEVTE